MRGDDNRNGVVSTLTPCELRVLRLLASGMHTKAIAIELSITPKTVSMHIQNAMRKLGVHTRTQAVALAHQLGLVNASGSGLAEVEADAVSGTPRRGRALQVPTVSTR